MRTNRKQKKGGEFVYEPNGTGFRNHLVHFCKLYKLNGTVLAQFLSQCRLTERTGK